MKTKVSAMEHITACLLVIAIIVVIGLFSAWLNGQI